ncbi:MAG: PDZ domain-containing protein, partial [Myxococcota bacterium]
DALAASYGLKQPDGALISEVVSGGPGSSAGLRDGDIVLKFDGKPIRESSDLPLYASMAGVGNSVDMLVWRNNKKITLGITLAAFPSDDEVLAAAQPSPKKGRLGLTINDITPDLRKKFDLESRRGAVVTDVERGSAAAQAGLLPGDVIIRVNGKDVGRARQFAETVKKSKKNAYLRIQIARGNGRMWLAVRTPS